MLILKTVSKRIFRFIGVLVLAGSGLVATGATAAIVVDNLGTLDPGDSAFFFEHTTFAQLASGEVVKFQVSEQAAIGAAARSINFFSALGISSFGVALVEATGNGGTDFSTFNSLATGTGGRILTLSYAGLTSGPSLYGLLFTGNVTGRLGGVYKGFYSVSAVPLPAAVWLFLSALIGLVGVVGRRRAKLRRGAADRGLAAA